MRHPSPPPPKPDDANDQTPTVATLPFVNMSADAEQNYFADGMTEDIFIDLSGVDAVFVAAKSASQFYRGTSLALAQISAEMGGRYSLEGSVRKTGNDIRVTARLNLMTTVTTATANRTTANVEAHQYYLRAQVARQKNSKRGIELAYDPFKQAVTIAPDYAVAHTAIAGCAALLCVHYDVDRAILFDALDRCKGAVAKSKFDRGPFQHGAISPEHHWRDCCGHRQFNTKCPWDLFDMDIYALGCSAVEAV